MEIPILILDNNEDFLKILRIGMEDVLTIKATSDTNEFIQWAVDKPSICIIDYFLDMVTGVSVMKKINEMQPLGFYIFMSSMASVQDLKDIINEGHGCFFIEKNQSDFFTELKNKVERGKEILQKQMDAWNAEAERKKILDEKLQSTYKILAST